MKSWGDQTFGKLEGEQPFVGRTKRRELGFYLDFSEETDPERDFDLEAVLAINVVDKTKVQKKES